MGPETTPSIILTYGHVQIKVVVDLGKSHRVLDGRTLREIWFIDFPERKNLFWNLEGVLTNSMNTTALEVYPKPSKNKQRNSWKHSREWMTCPHLKNISSLDHIALAKINRAHRYPSLLSPMVGRGFYNKTHRFLWHNSHGSIRRYKVMLETLVLVKQRFLRTLSRGEAEEGLQEVAEEGGR